MGVISKPQLNLIEMEPSDFGIIKNFSTKLQSQNLIEYSQEDIEYHGSRGPTGPQGPFGDPGHQAAQGFDIYVVSRETKEITQHHILHIDSTFAGVIKNLKKLGKPSNLFYYNGNTVKIKPTDKVSSYLPNRQSQVLFWTASNQLEFPVVQPKENNILVLMITPDYEMLAFSYTKSTNVNQITSDYGSAFRLAYGNQTKITGGTLSENLPARYSQIMCLLGEKKYDIVEDYQKTIEARFPNDEIINLISAENIPMAGPTSSTTIIIETLRNKVAALMERNQRFPMMIKYIDVTRMTPTGTGTRVYFDTDAPPLMVPKLSQNMSVSETFPIAYTTEDQYKAALKMMGLTNYYP